MASAGPRHQALPGEVNENAEVTSRPMSYRKFQEMLRGIFMQLGATADAAVTFSYNSLRRVAPTAALFFNLSSEQAQAISNWQDVPEAAKSKDVPAALQRSTFPMSRHYAGMKTMESARIKLCLFLMMFDCVKRTIRRRQSEGKGAFAKNAEGLVPFGSITWQDMVPQRRPSSEYQELIQAKQTLVDPGASMRQWTSAAVLKECRPQLGRSERAIQPKKQRLEPLDTLLMDTTQQRPKYHHDRRSKSNAEASIYDVVHRAAKETEDMARRVARGEEDPGDVPDFSEPSSASGSAGPAAQAPSQRQDNQVLLQQLAGMRRRASDTRDKWMSEALDRKLAAGEQENEDKEAEEEFNVAPGSSKDPAALEDGEIVDSAESSPQEEGSCSGSSEPETSESDEAEEGVIDLDEVNNLSWFRQKGSSIVHTTDEIVQGRFRPLCRTEPFSHAHEEEGQNPADQGCPVHDRCLLKLAPPIRRAVVHRMHGTADSSDME